MTKPELLRNLDSRIKALISYRIDQEEIKVRLDPDTHNRVYFAAAFSRVIIGRMLLEFLGVGYSTERMALYQKKPKQKDIQASHFGLALVDVLTLPPCERVQLEKFYSASHKLVHLTDDPDFNRNLAPDIDPGISLIARLVNQYVYRPNGMNLVVPDKFRVMLDKEQPGWDA
ncbi:MAG: hypothetical protein IPI55_14055 [Flavobacteriales bacterium]|nr:hypothetical protein [Flavobacteriales bacterium]